MSVGVVNKIADYLGKVMGITRDVNATLNLTMHRDPTRRSSVEFRLGQL